MSNNRTPPLTTLITYPVVEASGDIVEGSVVVGHLNNPEGALADDINNIHWDISMINGLYATGLRLRDLVNEIILESRKGNEPSANEIQSRLRTALQNSYIEMTV